MLEAIEDLANGLIPQSLEDLSTLGRMVTKVNARTSQTMAVIISIGREKLKDDKKWVKWCEEEFNLDKPCYRSHLIQFGDMLNGLLKINSVVYYKKLFDYSVDVLLAISRIPIENIGAFISDNPKLNYRDRDDVRLAVYQFLGEKPKEKAVQLSLPGFDDALDALVCINPKKLLSVIDSNDKAKKSIQASMGLLGASMEYYKASKDLNNEMLVTIKKALLDEIEELNELIEDSSD